MIRRLPPSIAAIATRGASILASFLLTVVVARALPVEGAGAFFVVYTAGAVVATFGRFGVDNLAIKLLGGGVGAAGELRHGWWLVGIAGTLGACLFGPGLALMPVDGLGTAGLVWAAVTIPPQALAVVAGAVLRGRGHMVAGVLAELGSIPTLAGLFILGAALGPGATLDGAVAALAVAALLTAAWSVPLALSVTRAAGATGDRGPAAFRAFLRRRGPALASMMGTSLVFYAVAWAPVLSLTLAGRPHDVAWVTAATRLANMVTLVPSIQVSYLAPQFAALYHAGDTAALSRLARSSTRRAFAVVAAPALVLVLAAPWVVGLLYGPDFRPAAPLLAVLALGALAAVGLGQVNQLMLICDLERRGLLLSVVLVAVWATFGTWLAVRSGAEAVVLLSVVGNVVYAVVAAVLLRRVRGVVATV